MEIEIEALSWLRRGVTLAAMRMLWRSLLICGVVVSSALAGEPSQAALQMFKRLGKENFRFEDIRENLALSPYLGPRRQRLIERRWVRLAEWARSEGIEFTEGVEKRDGELAAVIIGARSMAGPQAFEIVPLTMVKRGGQWQVGPVEGSFSNTGLGFSERLRERAKKLSAWLQRQRHSGGEKLRAAQREVFLEELKGQVSAKELQQLPPKEVYHRFLKAVREKRINEILAWLGVLEPQFANDHNWSETVQAVRLGLKDQDARRVWRLLLDPAVVRVDLEVDGDADDEHVTIVSVFSSPFRTGRLNERMHSLLFELENLGNGWRVRLPGFFRAAHQSIQLHDDALREDQDYDIDQRAEEFPARFEKLYSPLRTTTAKETAQAIVAEGKARNYAALLRRLLRPDPVAMGAEDLSDIYRVMRERYEAAGSLYEGLLAAAEKVEIQMARVIERGELAIAIIEVAPTGVSWEPTYVPIWLYRDEQGWAVLGDERDSLPEQVWERLKEQIRKLRRDHGEVVTQLAERYQLGLATRIQSLDRATKKPITHGEASKLVRQWRDAVRQGQALSALDLGAVIKVPPKGAWMLDDLSYAIKSARHARNEDQILGIQTNGRFTAVSLLVDVGREQKIECPLLLVVATPAGPRVLLDVEMSLPTNGGKKLRNSDDLAKVEKQLGKEDADALRNLLKWHTEQAGPAWKKWHQDNNRPDEWRDLGN